MIWSVVESESHIQKTLLKLIRNPIFSLYELSHRRLLWPSELLEPSGDAWSHLEPSGAISSYLDISGGIWRHLEPSGIIWRHLELSGGICNYLESSGASWSHLGHLEPYGPSGAIWNHLEPSGAILSYMDSSEGCQGGCHHM